MIKKLILILGLVFLITLNIKLQFDKIKLQKQLNFSIETIENFKLTLKSYQDLIMEITTRVIHDCPEMLNGEKHPPILKAPSSGSKSIEVPDVDIDKDHTMSPDQQYKINDNTPEI